MQFCYTPDERELLAFARQSIRGNLPLDRLRADESEVMAWAALGRDGWLHACLGGEEDPLPISSLAGIAREAGAVAAGPEFVHNAWVIPRLCAAIPDGPESAAWLDAQLAHPGYLGGLTEGVGSPRTTSVELGAHEDFDRYEVVDEGGALQLIRRPGGTDRIARVAGLSLSAGRVESGGSPPLRATLDLAPAELAQIDAGISVLRCAALVGSADELLVRTVAYVSEREQFGQPLGKFQAVKHLCADVYAELQVAWLSVLYAALCWQDDPTALPAARAHAGASALSAARVGAQLHGGMGFTWESDVHWLLKAVLDGQLCVQSSAAAAQQIGESVLESV